MKGYLGHLKRRDLVERVCEYLWNRNNLESHLNVSILAEHIQSLDDSGCSEFLS